MRKLMAKDLYHVYELLRRSKYKCRELRLYELAVEQPAPRYYISVYKAYRNIYPLMFGDFSKLRKMKPLKQEMYLALFREVIQLSTKREHSGKSLMHIIPFAIVKPAKRFYISPRSARRIICEYKWKKKHLS